MNEKFTVKQLRYFLLGVIDGIIQGIGQDIDKIRIVNSFGVKILEEERERFIKEREKVFNQIKGRGEYEHIS